MNRDNRPKRILIVRLDRIGDVLLSTPVIKALRDAYPGSYLAFMVRPYARDIVEGNPYLNEVIIYDKERIDSALVGNLKVITKLREYKFDIAIVLHPSARSHLITFLAGIPVRVGYDRKMGFLLTKKIPHTKQFGLKHEIDYALDVLRYIGVEPKGRTLYMPVKEACEKRVEELFGSAGIKKEDPVVVISPGASCASKRWSTENFAKVADDIAEKYKMKIAVVSGAEDKAFGDNVASSIKGNCINLSGKTSVGDLASILVRSKLFISNDSGSVHIACAVGTPVITIFGRSDRGLSPERWGPSNESDVVLHKDVGCARCLAHECKIGFKCLEAITVEDVLAAAGKILGQVQK